MSRSPARLPTPRFSRNFQIGAIALIVLAAIVLVAFFYDDVPEALHLGGRLFRQLYARNAFLPGFVLLYLEESGIPLPAPGDVFVMYVGVHVPHHLGAWIVAWLGLILAVVLGATNLFFISRRFGRRLVDSQFAEYVHLSHERMVRAERWFARYGVLAIIFGRHIPGFRIPITVAAAVFQVPYRVFAPSVAVSTAIWAGVVLIIGINFGPRLADLLRVHSFLYFLWAAIVGGIVLWVFIRQRLRRRRAAAVGKRERPVESPSS